MPKALARESGGKPTAVQTLRVCQASRVFAKRLECVCLSTALSGLRGAFLSNISPRPKTFFAETMLMKKTNLTQ